MKFRKKPIVVEASQWTGPRSDGPTPTPLGVYHDENVGFHVTTIHGKITPIDPGDWIIVESQQPVKGFTHAYPCKPDIFAATYEPLALTADALREACKLPEGTPSPIVQNTRSA
jgi:hypothetical protein